MDISSNLPPGRVRQAVLLVGGKGTRLGELTRATPKPLMPIGEGQVFLDLLIHNFARQGFDRILLLAGFAAEQIVSLYDGKTIWGATIEVIVEQEPLGTGGAVRSALDKLEPMFILANGDSYFDMNCRSLDAAMQAAPHMQGAMALRRVEEAGRYGSIHVDGNIVARFEEKVAHAGPGLINAGIYLLRREIIAAIPVGASSLEADIFPGLAAKRQLLGVEGAGYFIDIGLPETLTAARAEIHDVIRRPAVFLDRDGVLNHDHGYVHRWDRFDWIDGAIDTIRRFNDSGWFVFVVTNQAGVAHGYYEEHDIHLLHDAVRDHLALRGAFVDAFYYCPYHPNGRRDEYRQDHPDRKPRAGMIKRALADWPVRLDRMVLIGDRETDLAAAAEAGIPALHFEGGNLAEFLGQSDFLPGCFSTASRRGS